MIRNSRCKRLSLVIVNVLVLVLSGASDHAAVFAAPATVRIQSPAEPSDATGLVGERYKARSEARRAGAEYFHFRRRDDESVHGGERYRLRGIFPRVPYVNEEYIKSVIAVSDNPKAAGANPKDFFDNRFLKELEDRGFVRELYGS